MGRQGPAGQRERQVKARDRIAVGPWRSRMFLGALAIVVLCLALGAGTALAAAPAVTVEDAANVGSTTADVEGTVDPEGQATNWRFQFATEADFSNAQEGPSGSTETAKTVNGQLGGLQPNTTYHLRLLAENGEGTSEAIAASTFTTLGAAPLVDAFAAGPVSFDQVDINAEINPRNSATVYWFEWGSEDCSAPGAACESIPAEHDAFAGAGGEYRYVSRHLSGLAPQTTYHFRVVAENESGTTEGDDQEFTTAAQPPATCANEARRSEQQSGYLPDCRAYEMVSPPEKEGGNIAIFSAGTEAAADGSAAVFTSFTGFDDPEGMGSVAQYLSQRGPGSGGTGWSTHPITPEQDALPFTQVLFGQLPQFEAAFTPDLSYGVYRSRIPLTDDPWTSENTNFYLRGNLRNGTPVDQLLSGCPRCETDEEAVPAVPPFLRGFLAGASRDLSHILFESFLVLTPDAPAFPGKPFGPMHLYESVNGKVRLVGVLPDGSPAPTSTTGMRSSATHYPLRMISADGERVFFEVPSDGSIYMREGGATTVQLNKSERSEPESPQPARLFTASEDGSRAFFMTDEGLVEDDNNHSRDVYMYDLSKPEGERLTLISVDRQPADSHYADSILGASADGHYVYFASQGQLVAGQRPVPSDDGLYLWHDGVVKYIGALDGTAFPSTNELWMNSPEGEYAYPIKESAVRITPDGRDALFISHGDAGFKGRGGFPGYDQGTQCTFDTSSGGPCRELYLYSADSGRLACVSCGAPGTTATSDALDTEKVSVGAAASNWHLSQALSDDGRYVFFDTGQSLVERDVNGEYDAYAYDTRTGQVHLLSSGTSSSGSYFLDASDDGRDAFFVTAEQLLGWDHDQSYDLYDARVGGGFAEPSPAPASCAGEACRGASSAAPPPPAAGSGSTQGKGNLPGRHCPKGRRAVRRHGKTVCVKGKKRHHRKHDRATNHDRRASR